MAPATFRLLDPRREGRSGDSYHCLYAESYELTQGLVQSIWIAWVHSKAHIAPPKPALFVDRPAPVDVVLVLKDVSITKAPLHQVVGSSHASACASSLAVN